MLCEYYNEPLYRFFEGILEDEFQAKFTQRADGYGIKLYTFEINGFTLYLAMDSWSGIEIESIPENNNISNEKEIRFIIELEAKLLARKDAIWQEVQHEIQLLKTV